MGNKSSRQKPLCVSLAIYHGSEFINDYVITNYNSQIHRFPGGQAINFRFVSSPENPKNWLLQLRFAQDISVNKDRTFKEGSTMFVHLNVPAGRTPESSFGYELGEYRIPWKPDLNYIQVTY